MMLSDYWRALNPQRRTGLIVGAIAIAALAAGGVAWLLLHDSYVVLHSGLRAEQVNELSHRLDGLKISHRIGEEGDAVEVRRSELGRARAAAAGRGVEAPPGVGLELFEESDFSTTDFAQRINYQRALQGELTRTIQTIEGVRGARVHVTLAESGLFKREAARATAAVSVALQPGIQLSSSQVRGIQRLVAAAVPQIRLDDVIVLDESGAALTRATRSDDEPSSAQLDIKREVDRYFEGKLQRLLLEVAPRGTASISVDALLDDRQIRVTTDQPLSAEGGDGADRPAGVLVKERQAQRGGAAGYAPVDSDASGGEDSTEWEHEYAVGRRTEQMLTAPGSIKRLSVSVVLQGAPAGLTEDAIARVVSAAIGLDVARGDAVTVLLIPRAQSVEEIDVEGPMRGEPATTGEPSAASTSSLVVQWWVFGILLLATAAAVVAWTRLQAAPQERPRDGDASAARDAELDALTRKVRDWMQARDVRERP
ncbi:flagellar M-ring protein FliF [Povalibacter uvarum]|uniref:Flagellar M-ring protein n=1 Tax=Povalibacter uvarum TaxID=732238 RepID=A0A841HDK9_9GAMM|nr:flagellar basal-body MS-ring/collar protein FliF [Povalibacter uvarum]MBB6091171.1 flagellar M-ring protein FliF [Povalibacter uvarum]